MIRVDVNGVTATVTEKEILTAGRVGLECAFSFTGEWDGLFKTAVFQGMESVDVALPDSTCIVPWEAMQVEGVQLKIGVYGANGEGTIVIPTIWVNAGKIQPSAIGSGTEPTEPSQNANAYAVETAEEAKNIALSVQQRADNGEFDGEPGAPGADGADGSTLWTTTVEPAVPIGGGYEFYVSDLTGVSGGTPAVGDIIFYDSAYYPITSVTGHSVIDRKAIANTRTSIRGATGPAATDQQVQTAVDAWLEEHPAEINEQVQDAVDEYLNNHPTVTGTFSNEAKNALLTLLEKVAYTIDGGQNYYDALEAALLPPAALVSISAVFEQGQTVIYDTDSLDVLKPMLTVTAHYSDSTTETVTAYTLSGTLTVGTSTITVGYGDKTATFNVSVTEKPTIGSLTAGTEVAIMESNVAKPWIYLGKDDNDNCILMRKNSYSTKQMNSAAMTVMDYDGTTMDTWLTGDYLTRFTERLVASLSPRDITMSVWNTETTTLSVKTISRAVYVPSMFELGFGNINGSEGGTSYLPVLKSYYGTSTDNTARIANTDSGSAIHYWSRTASNRGARFWYCRQWGDKDDQGPAVNLVGYRPMMSLLSTTPIAESEGGGYVVG